MKRPLPFQIPPPGPSGRRDRGFSLVEVAIASVFLLVIMLGIVPLFTRAMSNNLSGFDYTRVSNAARERAEEFFQLPFNSEPLTINAGTERAFDEFYSYNNDTWLDGTEADAAAAGDKALLTRRTVVRQFNVNDLVTPLDNTAPPGAVQIKEITVAVQATPAVGTLGLGKQNSVRLYKAQ